MRQRNPRGDGNPHNNGPNGRLSGGGGRLSDLADERRAPYRAGSRQAVREDLRTAPFRSDSRRAMGGARSVAPPPMQRRGAPGPVVGNIYNNPGYRSPASAGGGYGGAGTRPGGGYSGGGMRQSYQGGYSTHGSNLHGGGMDNYYPGRTSYNTTTVGRTRYPGVSDAERAPIRELNGDPGRPAFQQHPEYGVPYHGSYGPQGGYSQVGSPVQNRLDSTPGLGAVGGHMPSPNR
jgi:hypothetical protein